MKKSRTMQFADCVAALLGMGLGAVAIYMTLSFKKFKNVPVGPEVFPRIMAVGLMVCSLVLFLQAMVKKSKKAAPTLSLKDRGIRHVLLGIALMAAFYLLWKPLGFLILSPLVLLGLMLLADYRRWTVMAVVAVLVTVAVWLLFWQVLSIELPVGPFEFLY